MGPGILMSAMLLFYVLLVDKKKLVNPPMAKAMMKEERSIRELFFRALPIAIAPLLILITMLSGIFSPGETGGMAVLYMPVSYTHLEHRSEDTGGECLSAL